MAEEQGVNLEFHKSSNAHEKSGHLNVLGVKLYFTEA